MNQPDATHRNRLEFANGRIPAVSIAAVTGLIGLGFMFVGVVAFRQGGALFAMISPVLLGISLAFGLGRNLVTIDSSSRSVIHSWTILNHEWTEEYRFNLFREVGVRSVGARNSGRVHFRVMLKGTHSIYIPGHTYHHDADALAFAREIADRMNLPVDETPRVGFFGR